MKEMIEIRWHGRGGQGVVTAAQLLAQSALKEDKFFQSFPEFGPERMGAPITAYSRVSPGPITLYCNVESPDVVVVLDPTLIGTVDLTKGLKPEGAIIVNTDESPAELKKKLGTANGQHVYAINASQIAKDEIGRAIPNTPMLGAVIKATEVLDLDTAKGLLKEQFSKKFAEQVVQGNLNAIDRAYKEVKAA
jgi:pyruvate ferredoxin oxidoreductase gamma subunit